MINHFFECLVPISKCNLKCEYCYVMQQHRRDIETPQYSYTLEEWKKAISIERIGKSFFSFCGYGETLLDNYLVNIVIETLKEGHLVNITNNGTMTKNINRLLSIDSMLQKNLLLSFSLHYEEVKKRNMLNLFANNVKAVMQSEISCFVQINLCDSYIGLKSEIMEYCNKYFGCLPHVALTRRENFSESKIDIYSELEFDDYKKVGAAFDSKLFEFTCSNFNVKRDEFCYAGEKSYCIDLANGDVRRCYAEPPFTNFFDDLHEPLPAIPIGYGCKDRYCLNSSHFLALGMIENKFTNVSYVGLRNRKNEWIKNCVKEELSLKIQKGNNKKALVNLKGKNIYIYGAGVAAKEIIFRLKEIGYEPITLFVSQRLENFCSVEDYDVIQYNSCYSLKESAVLFIAVKNHYSIKEIKEKVDIVAFDEVYTYYDFLRYDFL